MNFNDSTYGFGGIKESTIDHSLSSEDDIPAHGSQQIKIPMEIILVLTIENEIDSVR